MVTKNIFSEKKSKMKSFFKGLGEMLGTMVATGTIVYAFYIGLNNKHFVFNDNNTLALYHQDNFLRKDETYCFKKIKYNVVPGDTVDNILRKYNSNVNISFLDLRSIYEKFNEKKIKNGKDIYLIFPSEKIYIPKETNKNECKGLEAKLDK